MLACIVQVVLSITVCQNLSLKIKFPAELLRRWSAERYRL